MSIPQRLASTFAALCVGVGTILLLTFGGARAQGPMARAFSGVGDLVSETESRLAQRARGPGRRASLEWAEPYRSSPDALRTPEELLLGAYDSGIPMTLEGVLALESVLGSPFPLVQLYTAWGDKPEQQYPRRLVQAITDLGSIPVITWEPWLSDFDERLRPRLPDRKKRDRGGLAAIARGEYDFYIDRWAADAALHGRPLLVRFAHEMNDAYRYPWGPHNNSPQEYREAWTHVVGRFRKAGADNVLWVWSPHVGFDGWETYYPGNAVVDWVATGALNYGTVAYWSRWWSFGEIFGSKYPRLASYGKPVMVAELGTLSAGGDRAAWYRDALRDLPLLYPRVKAVLFFHDDVDQTVTQQTLDWSFAPDSDVAAAVVESLGSWRAAPR
jgi:hypothetical protein